MPPGDLQASTTIGDKICHVCGADVAGKPRQRDEKGRYWCMACAKKSDRKSAPESSPRRPKTVQCPDCGQAVAPVLMKTFDGSPICESCLGIRTREQAKAQARREAAARGGEEEKRQRSFLYVLLAVALVLGLFSVFWNGLIKL
jgi:DNA-directed RNA polymerase subunit RPC12/RpoP